MRRKNVKIGAVILLYSLVITAVFLGGILLFQNYSSDMQEDVMLPDSPSLYILDENDFRSVMQGDTPIIADSGKLTFINEFYEQFNQQMCSRLIPVIVGFCLFLILSSLMLWHILKQIQARDTLRIAKNLTSLTEEGWLQNDDPLLKTAYEKLQTKFSDHLEDYKRLYSYLSHDQKNAIAILRAELELENRPAYLKKLDLLTDSINDILTLSENEELSTKTEVDVALICASVCDDYQTLAKKLTFTFDEEKEATIYAKERWISRALSNLLDNAVKYGRGNPIEVHVSTRHNCVVVSVRDHGIGIGAAQLEQIFEHHYRVNELKPDGYGIGLSLVSHVCDLCGGFATVESELGKGSTFYLSFPSVAY